MIGKGQSQAFIAALDYLFNQYRTAAAVDKGIPGQLARSRHNLGLIHQR
jgi:hypothetical protein